MKMFWHVCFLLILIAQFNLVAQMQHYYFAYGGYMNHGVIRRDLGYLPKSLGVYQLDDYEFSYSRAPLRLQATGGNIQANKGKVVYGVVWELTEKDLAILDKEEQAPLVYKRTHLIVKNQLGSMEVEAYVATPAYISSTFFPRPSYVKKVVEGAQENGLPGEYIKSYLEWQGPLGSEEKKATQ